MHPLRVMLGPRSSRRSHVLHLEKSIGHAKLFSMLSYPGSCAALLWFCLSRCILCSLSTVRAYLIIVIVSIVGRTNFSPHTISLAPSPHHLHIRRRGPCMPHHEQTSVSVFVSRYPDLLRRAVGHLYPSITRQSVRASHLYRSLAFFSQFNIGRCSFRARAVEIVRHSSSILWRSILTANEITTNP